MQTNNINFFEVKGQTITKVKANTRHQLLMLPVIDAERTFSFKIRIVKTGRYILIGILEKDQIANQYSRDKEESTTYSGDGYKYPGHIKEGSGFTAGDVVETTVRLSEGSIQWRVNGQIQVTTIKPRLSNPNK